MPTSRSLATDSVEIPSRAFLKQVKGLADAFLRRTGGAAPPFRRRLRQLGFDKAQEELLAGITPGAAVSAAKDNGLKSFFKQVETAGEQLARWNLHPNRIAAALRDYGELVWRKDAPDAEPGLKSLFDQLQFGIILGLNNAYYNVREAETRALFDLYRATIDCLDAHLPMRRFVESMADFFGASAGHIFVLDANRNSWELKASTAIAVSPQTNAAAPVNAAARRKLRTPFETSAGSPLLLDSGWNKKGRHCWSVPIFVRGEFGGVLQLAFSQRRRMLPRDIELLSVAGEQSLAAAERSQFVEEIAARERRMSVLVLRMLQVEENERRRISRELHDDAGQSLVVIRLQMEMIEQSMPPDAEWRERLAEARDITETTILHMRRLISDLSPPVLEQLGLAAGLRQLVSRFRRAYPCGLRLHIGKLPQLLGDFQIIVYRLAQECLNNISLHSKAKHVNISVTVADRELRLHVVDDGIGFHVEEALGRRRCFGLVGMRERVALLGGSCRILSAPTAEDLTARANDAGTEIDIRLPIPPYNSSDTT